MQTITKNILYGAASFLISSASICHGQSEPQLGKESIDEVIAAMTLEEKISTVIGVGFDFPGVSLDSEMRAPEGDRPPQKVPGAAGDSFQIPRLGVPSIVLADGPAGLRIQPLRQNVPNQTFYATAFPIATLLASTWDTELVEKVGRAMGNEVKEYGADVLLSPALNIHRYPLGGRNFEYYSEDPLISGKMAAAIVKGVQSQGVGTSLKHFVANNHEWNRYVIDVQADQRALREIYLRGFEIAVKESNPWTVMTSYNKLNGVYTSERSDLINDVLKNEWGFDGFVMTDWFAGRDAVAQMKAGNDMLMPGTLPQQKSIRAAIQSGELNESVLDRNIKNILDIVTRSPSFKNYKYSDKPNLTLNAEIARNAAAEGMVLLKNTNSTLPLKPSRNIALFGNTSYKIITGGTGSGDVNEAYSISMVQGLKDKGFTIDTELQNLYESHIDKELAAQPPGSPFMLPPSLAEMEIDTKSLDEAAKNTDLAIFTLGRNSGEVADRKVNGDFYLSKHEKQLIKEISSAFRKQNKNFIVVLNIGGTIETISWRDQADAVLLAWQPGQEAGHAIADVLSGAVSPSGRLATSFSATLEDYPQHSTFPGKVLEKSTGEDPSFMNSDEAAEIIYDDGIWVGYRHFNTQNIEVAYPFGFGLSYTQFKFSRPTISSNSFDDEIAVVVTVTNTGKIAGKEVVQLYVAAPKKTMEKPSEELRAFAKTRLLAPGESQTLTMTLNSRDLSSFDSASNQWVAESGNYTVKLGRSSRDITSELNFSVAKNISTDP